MEGLLRVKNALITGAGRGIGKGIAFKFAQQGARCILVGRTRPPLEQVMD